MSFDEVWKELLKDRSINERSVMEKTKLKDACQNIYEQGYMAGSAMQRKLLRMRVGLSEEWDK